MYHCHIQFYVTGRQRRMAEVIRRLSLPGNFTDVLKESEEPEADLTSEADVIFAALRKRDRDIMLQELIANKRQDAVLILLADRKWDEIWKGSLTGVDDVWMLPMTEEELGFRFSRWAQEYQKSRKAMETEQYLQAVINGSPNLIWFKSKEGIHEKVNNSFCKIVNKTKEQIEGRRHAYIWNVEADDPVCMESEKEVMCKQKTCVSEETVRTGEGSKLLTTYKSPLYDLDGSVMGTVGVAIDVTQERAYEKEITEKNQTLEMVLTTMDCGVLCHSIDGKEILSVNRAALEILGYESREELLADGFRTVARSVLDEDRVRLGKCIESLKKEGDNAEIEYRVRHKNGEIRHVMGSVKLIEKDGRIFYQRYLLDCTAQKLREREEQRKKNLQIEYQERLFEIFGTYLSKNTDDVYMMLNGDADKAEYISPNVERVLGISRKDVEKDLRNFGRAEYIGEKKVTYDEVKRLSPGEEIGAAETKRINPKTGEHKWFLEKIYCVSIQDLKKIVIYISDRTKERKVHDTLTEALNMANVANKAKTTFLGSVSHDIRTPMNAIMGLTNLLKAENDNPKCVMEYAKKIDVSCQHLLDLINDVLDMNKIESGSMSLNISDINLAEIVDDLNVIIRPQAQTKDQTFDIATLSLIHENVRGDKLRINQILLNILSNAVKYTPQGGKIKMQVNELRQMNRKYCRLQFIISDNGAGMSKEYQKEIFNPFTREKDTTINSVQGTGLGMAITKSLVDLMSGTIKVESKEGEGSTFTVNLELKIHEGEEDSQFWKDNGIVRMIVADKDKSIREDVVRVMEKAGVSIDSAVDGKSSLEMIRKESRNGNPYDVILLDWRLLGVNGLETIRRMRENGIKKIPIMVFTAYDFSEIDREVMEAGMDHFMMKPFFISNFKRVISQIVDHEQSRPAPEKKKSIVMGKNVLVVDDIEINRMILMKILGKQGAVCDTANNGKEALEMFENSKPGQYDIIFMDVQMPVMNGYDAARAIRSSTHPSAKSVAIIATTANAFSSDVQYAMESGMDAHIAKPITMDQMEATVREVLKRKGAAGAGMACMAV